MHLRLAGLAQAHLAVQAGPQIVALRGWGPRRSLEERRIPQGKNPNVCYQILRASQRVLHSLRVLGREATLPNPALNSGILVFAQGSEFRGSRKVKCLCMASTYLIMLLRERVAADHNQRQGATFEERDSVRLGHSYVQKWRTPYSLPSRPILLHPCRIHCHAPTLFAMS